jgi:hypothetical protein
MTLMCKGPIRHLAHFFMSMAWPHSFGSIHTIRYSLMTSVPVTNTVDNHHLTFYYVASRVSQPNCHQPPTLAAAQDCLVSAEA